MKIEVKDNPRYPCKVWIPEEASDFVDKIKTDLGTLSVKLFIDLIPAGYYHKDDSYYTYIGPASENKDKERTPYSKNYQTLNITFTTNRDWIDLNRHLLDSLYTTPGGRASSQRTVWSKEDEVEYVPRKEQYGAYKKPVFDEIYPSMKKHQVVDNEDHLATYPTRYIPDSSENFDAEFKYNKDFVDVEKYHGDKNCISTWTRKLYQEIQIDQTHISISIIITDLERNTPTLLEILTNFKNHVLFI